MENQYVIRVVTALVLAVGLGACSKNEDVGKLNAYPATTIGVSISSTDTNPFFQGMYRSFDEISKHNAPLTLMLNQASNDQRIQDSQIEEMLNKGAKALIINLVNMDKSSIFVQKMCKRKIPVVYINRSPDARSLANCPYAYVVDGDAVQAGVLQGLQVLNAWKANPKWDKNGDGVIQYALLSGIVEHPGAQARSKWSVGTVQNYPKLGVNVQKIFQEPAMFSREVAMEVMERWIKMPEFSQVEVLLANNDSMAMGVIDVLQKYNIRNIPVFGIDGSSKALKAFKEGTLAGTVFNDYDEQARVAARIAANLAVGDPANSGLPYEMEYKVVKVPYQNIDNTNIDQFLKLNGG